MSSVRRIVRGLASGLILMSIAACAAAPPQTPSQHQDEITAVATAIGISNIDAATRDALRQKAEPLVAAVGADKDHFAGAYTTDDGGLWRLVVRYVGPEPQPAVRALAPPDVPIQWLPARYSMAELERVGGELLGLQRQVGLKRISQVSPDPVTNTVLVGLPHDDPALKEQIIGTYGGTILSFAIVATGQ